MCDVSAPSSRGREDLRDRWLRVDNAVVAQAAFEPGVDGTASRSLLVEQVPATGAVVVEAHGGAATCTAMLKPGAAVEVRCPGG